MASVLILELLSGGEHASTTISDDVESHRHHTGRFIDPVDISIFKQPHVSCFRSLS
jgi:hypothetical protein